MRRLAGPSDVPPVIETAVAHDLDWTAEPASNLARRGPRLAAVNPAPSRKPVPTQPALFPFRDDQKVVRFNTPAIPTKPRGTEGSKSTRRRMMVEGQSSFDFDAPPAPNVLAHASDKNTHLAVAPIPLRAMSAMFDLGLAGGLTGLFLTTVRLTLGYLPTGSTASVGYAGGAVLLFCLYKLLFCLYGRPTFGPQGARLRLVSFNGTEPRRSQVLIRFVAGCVGVLSAGMGLLWCLADQDKLTWHDHISQTFLTTDSDD
jgi:uncharacterized RDD family membrane protein YckC